MSTLFAIPAAFLYGEMVEPHWSNFRIITAIDRVSEYLGILRCFLEFSDDCGGHISAETGFIASPDLSKLVTHTPVHLKFTVLFRIQ